MDSYMVQNKTTVFCKISEEHQPTWIDGIITNINQDKKHAEVFISAKHFKDKFNQGSRVMVKSSSDANEILFTGTVVKKAISIRKQAVTIKIDRFMSYSNNRKYERLLVNYATILKNSDGLSVPAAFIDISYGGAMVFSDSSMLNENDIIDMDILIAPDMTLSLSGRIIRKISGKKNCSYAIQFEELDSENHASLHELIEFLLIQKNYIEHEWKIFKVLKYAVYTISTLAIIIIVFIIFVAETG